jgi:hypothetical protein
MRWRVIDGCPCPRDVAPYIYIVLRGAGQTAAAIYRGDDKKAGRILHRYGKHTQRELANATAAQRAAWGVQGTPNPPGYSEHELRSDGVGNPHVPRGGKLEGWQIGVDSGGNDEASQRAIEHAAHKHHWHVRHPYSAGIEGHHWCFATHPKPHGLKMRLRIAKLRATLPRR